ncbi:MAG: magnesium/cobalt transporter CorA [bacterium]
MKNLFTVPGTLNYTGDVKTGESRIETIVYDNKSLSRDEIASIDDVSTDKDPGSVIWINITGIDDIETVEQTGRKFNIHPLVLEDILNVGQRPKLETGEGSIFAVMKMASINEEKTIEFEQVSFYLENNILITFQERPGDVFDIVRTRIEKNRGIIRRMKADYLFYCLTDVLTDNYFSILEDIDRRIEDSENSITENISQADIDDIYILKGNTVNLKKYVWPLRDIAQLMRRNEAGVFSGDLTPYINDLYDHSVQLINTVESMKEQISALRDIYLTYQSSRMNEIMKVLTIIATIFIPLTFIAGIYGMNFEFMPELSYRWAYPAVWGIMIIVMGGMIVYFRKKKWF